MTEETWSRPSGRKADELRPIKITTLLPIVTPGRMMAPAPIHTLLPIVIG